MLFEKRAILISNQRMNQGLEAPQSIRLVEYNLAKLISVHRAIRLQTSRKSLSDCLSHCAASSIEAMNSRIRIVDWYAMLGEKTRGRGFPHTNRTGKSQHDP
ncbi:hypothetical protein GCM10007884_15020 [Methylobacterium brachythecii]|uniref:Transposase n=1 Tax=Methylobacterium brachythecii TaxID=1176177 RepID=A0ABQ6D5P4_9HYPH|nr:hypothetical protein GCM10007884_15020 [Methylobacterium brachythecii]